MLRITYRRGCLPGVIAVVPTAIAHSIGISTVQISAFLGRHRPADRGQRRFGYGAADRGQPDDAQSTAASSAVPGRRGSGSKAGSISISGSGAKQALPCWWAEGFAASEKTGHGKSRMSLCRSISNPAATLR